MTSLRLTALALPVIIRIPSGAHLFELPVKNMPARQAYFTVQQIYAGWALSVIPIAGAIVANAALFLVERRQDAIAAGAAH